MVNFMAEKTDVVILCGGLGKRLRSVVDDRPKVMAEIKNEPFLDILIEYAASFGFKRFILCVGYMSEAIGKHYKQKATPFEIIFSEEKEPLGTGGAIKNARSLIQSDPFLAMNGDSFCKLDFRDFYKFHTMKRAMLSVALSKLKNDQSSGVVILDEDGRIAQFKEKVESAKGGYSSVGIYLMQQEIFHSMGKKAFSLEYDIFPNLVGKDCYGYYRGDEFIDIGTPQNLVNAEAFLKKNNVDY